VAPEEDRGGLRRRGRGDDGPAGDGGGNRDAPAGGNAVDAAVAAGYAVGVVEPFNSGLGGIAVLVHHERRSGRTTVIDGTGALPQAIQPDQFTLVDGGGTPGVYGGPEVVDDENNTGWLTPAMPGMPACLDAAHERFGSLPLRDVLAPAIAYAADGFPVDWSSASGWRSTRRACTGFPKAGASSSGRTNRAGAPRCSASRAMSCASRTSRARCA